jgi:hypothetical protein
MNLLDRYALLANPLTTISSSAYKAAVKAAPLSDGLRLSNNPKLNLALWNTIGVASWAVPLAVVATALVNAKAKREVDNARIKSDDQLLNASRPAITPSPLKIDEDKGKDNKNVSRLKQIEADSAKFSKKAALSLFGSPILGALPITAVPVSYWLANKLATKFISDKIEDDLKAERNSLRALQDAEDLERLRLLGLVSDDKNKDKAADLVKEASDKSGKPAGLMNFFSGVGNRIKDETSGVDVFGLGKTLLWDVHLAPIFAASALLAIGGGMYMSGRDRSTKKIKLLTKKLLGENRMHDPATLSIELPKGISQGSDSRQLQRLEGIPTNDATPGILFSENNHKKDELFN